MALTILFGLLQIFADAKRNYHYAKYMQINDNVSEQFKNEKYSIYIKWKTYLMHFKLISRYFFGFGLIFLMIALYERVFIY